MARIKPATLALAAAWLGGFARDRRGVSMVEFALGASIFFLLTAGIIEVGRVMQIQNTIEHAVKEGSRYAAMHGAQSSQPKTNTELKAFVKDSLIGVDKTKLTVEIAWTPDATPGNNVVVSAKYPFNFWFARLFDTSEFDLEASSTYIIGR